MADWNNPTTSTAKVNVLTQLKERDDAAARLFSGTLPSNIIEGTKRWNESNQLLERWDGSSWNTEVLSLSGGGTGATSLSGVASAIGRTGNTANRLMARDSNGRSQVANPSTSMDIVNKQTLDSHINTNGNGVHGSTSSASTNRLVHRDGAGRAKVNAPSASDDIATRATVDVHANTETSGVHGATASNSGGKIPIRNANGVFNVGNATAGTHILNRNTADNRYGRLSGGNTWSGTQTFSDNVNINGDLDTSGEIEGLSDARVKRNVNTLEHALNNLRLLRGTEFWRQDLDHASMGVIAQELARVYPALVRRGRDGYLRVVHDGLTAVFIQAIKELDSKVADLEEEITVLKGQGEQ